MKKYPKYKNSNIDWIGDIPEHWHLKKLNLCFSSIGSGSTPKSGVSEYYLNGDVNWLLTGDLNDGEIYETSKKITKKAIEDYSTLKIYSIDSIVIAMYGATIGKLGLLKIETTVNQACCVMSKPQYHSVMFLFHYLFAVKPEILNMSYGGGQPNISQEILKTLKITVPPIKEQIAIANYLDKKTEEIDKLIEEKKQLIQLFEEEKKTIIYQAVTKGINIDTEMKDSGIDWIGKIPKHWNLKKVKHVFNSLNNIRIPLSSEERGKMLERTYDYYGASGIIDKVESYLFDEPLLLIGEDGANLLTRNSRLVFIAKGQYWVNNHAHILKPKFGVLEYYAELLELFEFSLWVTGSAQPKLTSENLMNIQMIVPPEEEQKLIMKFLEIEFMKINSKVKKTKKLIKLLTEYRFALINEAVTGKVKVID